MKPGRKRRSSQLNVLDEMAPIVRLWVLRLLVSLGAMHKFVEHDFFADDDLARALGLESFTGQESFDRNAVFLRLRQQLKECALTSNEVSVSPQIMANIGRLSGLVGLSPTEQRILEFIVLIHTDRYLENAGDLLQILNGAVLTRVLSKVLDIPEAEIRMATSSQGALARSGLVSFDKGGSGYLKNQMQLISPGFANCIVSSDADPISLLKDIVRPAKAATLALDDYPHIATSLDLLQPYLMQSLDVGRRGVNVLLYGKPGTGKSELARLLAPVLASELFEITSENCAGDSVSGEDRLRAYRAAQGLFDQRRVMLLFDEIEDVFNDGAWGFGLKSTAQKRKAWINRMLEENQVPTIWLSNNIESMDQAFLRRFDFVIELPIPPRKQRERIVREICKDLLGEKTIGRIADSASIAPALVTRTASVITALKTQRSDINADNAFESMLSATLVAQGHAPIRRRDPSRLPETYDPAFINADTDLMAMASEMKKVRSGRLCLYGPPGTGKTAYGRWLAMQLDVPIHIKRASDLISKWVGESEKNIANAFREAEDDGALLLIDEVDSFLQDRRGAQQSWEVSQVNEMLTQMESFAGVFIASTNLMEGLDQAALRRFDLKIKLGFLKAAQAWFLLERTCASLGLPPPAPSLQMALSRMDRLTPGDFALVVRQHQFRPLTSPDRFVAALASEVVLKEGSKAKIGFM